MQKIVRWLRAIGGVERLAPVTWIFVIQTLMTELGFFAIFPILGVVLQRTYSIAAWDVALLVAVFTVAVRGSFLLTPLLARGRAKTWLIASLTTAGVALGLVYFAQSTWVMLFLLTCAGVGISAYLTVSRAVISEQLTSPEDGVATFAILNLALNLAAAVGPIVGAFLLWRSFGRSLFGFAGGGYLVAAASVALLVPNRLAASTEAESPPRWRDVLLVFRRNPKFRRLALASAIGWCFYAQLFATLPLHLSFVLGEQAPLGRLFSSNAILVLGCQLPVAALVRWGTSGGRWGLYHSLGAAYTAFSLAFLIVGMSRSSLLGLYVAVAVFTLGELIFAPVSSALTASAGKAGDHILMFSARGLSDAVGEGIGVYLGIQALTTLHHHHQGQAYWYVACTLAVFGAVIVVTYKKTDKTAAAHASYTPSIGNGTSKGVLKDLVEGG